MVDGMIDKFFLGYGDPRENSIQVKENSNQFNFSLLGSLSSNFATGEFDCWLHWLVADGKLKVPVAIIVDVLFDVLMFILTFLIISYCCVY